MYANRNAMLKRTVEQAGFAEDLRDSNPDHADRNAPPEKPTVKTRPDRLHALPRELLDLIVDHLLPQSPYLPRPYGSETNHFTIAPALRALSSWETTCKQAQWFVAAVRKDDKHFEFRQLASAAGVELHPETRAALIERYGIDYGIGPTVLSSPPETMLIEVHSENGLAWRANHLKKDAGTLRKLELHLHKLHYEDLSLLVTAVGLCTGLHSLSIHSNMPFPLSLIEILQHMPSLRTLALRGKGFPNDLFARLARLPTASQLNCLHVSAPDLNLEQLQALNSAAPSFGQLRFLNLTARILGKPECDTIASACERLPRLESIQVGTTMAKLDAEGALTLVNLLRQSMRTHRLGLHNLADGELARAELFRTLRQDTGRLELRLTGRLELACVEEIGQLLTDSNMCLQVLDLDASCLDQDGFQALFKGLMGSTRLRELRLSRIEFNDEGAQALGNAIRASNCLLALTLDYCTIDTGFQLETLCAALSSNTSLRELHLKIEQDKRRNCSRIGDRIGNRVGNDLAHKFAAVASKSSSLLCMSMGPHRCSGLREAQNNLARNRRRLELGLDT